MSSYPFTQGESGMSCAVATCIGCGCDDMHACWDEITETPCSWIRLDRNSARGVCSACPEHVERWDNGDREAQVP
ncbi:hypothetical protein [Sulfurivermis fontis]|jgi:hypothetical protein|uniref:hypothetical protein n=1 Tax=Sulfurivermis fontis TaxID=1972068 RepID=UPI0018D59848|nr:hypothetical protein [Sulfurivermis fontis]